MAMIRTTDSIRRNDIFIYISTIILAILISWELPTLFSRISSIFERAIQSKGGKFEAIVLIFAPIIILIWSWFVFVKKQYINALFLQIAIFPFTYKAAKAFAIKAYVLPSGFVQQISLTTFLIVALFLILFTKRLIIRPLNKEWRLFEKLLLIFAISLTISQLFNHTFHSAIWLSVGAIWQFVILFYILSSIIKSKNDLIKIFNSLLVFTFVNILVRAVGEEQILVQSLTGKIVRIYAAAMGWAVSYAGYLAILITISIALFRIKRKKIYIAIIILLFIELLNTFTRGGFLAMFFLLVILFWKSERKFFFRSLIVLIPTIILFGGKIWQYVSYRGLTLGTSIINLFSVKIRINLFMIYFKEFFNFSLIGNGIGNGTEIYLKNRYYSPHNIVVIFLSETGIVVTILYILSFAYASYIAFKNYKLSFDKNYGFNIFYIYVFIALIQWFFFANTTSTSLTSYYPYEASTIFWILLFAPFLSRKYLMNTETSHTEN